MEFKKLKLIIYILFTALFLTGCSQSITEDTNLLTENTTAEVIEVTSEDIIEDVVVVENVEKDVELGELI
jgi:PBP1b-binding outer membrane lipoprotein LpoB